MTRHVTDDGGPELTRGGYRQTSGPQNPSAPPKPVSAETHTTADDVSARPWWFDGRDVFHKKPGTNIDQVIIPLGQVLSDTFTADGSVNPADIAHAVACVNRAEQAPAGVAADHATTIRYVIVENAPEATRVASYSGYGGDIYGDREEAELDLTSMRAEMLRHRPNTTYELGALVDVAALAVLEQTAAEAETLQRKFAEMAEDPTSRAALLARAAAAEDALRQIEALTDSRPDIGFIARKALGGAQ